MMKRSEINQAIRDTVAFLAAQGFHLPPFAAWTPADWAQQGGEADEVRACGLGWDVTDFSSGDFGACGLVIFTLRNGSPIDPRYSRCHCCERIYVSREGQVTPRHFHLTKEETIRNHAGGTLVIQVFSVTQE